MLRGHLQSTRLLCLLGLAVGALSALAGCTPHIGDKCQLNTDCSLSGTLQCDTAQPNGYCTFFNCTADSCQDKAACVLFNASVPGCPYDDYHSPARSGRTLCMAQCQSDSDCRQGEGYQCVDPRQPPWNAQIVDDDQSQRVCIPIPDFQGGVPASFVDAGGVCSPTGPTVPGIDAGGTDAGGEAGGDAAADAGGDGGGADGGSDGGSDGGDAATDGAADAGAADAPGE